MSCGWSNNSLLLGSLDISKVRDIICHLNV